MEARPVDPRDALTEETYPEYRVTFWERLRAPADIPLSRVGFRSDEWSVVGATSVFEVLAWAEAHCGPHRAYTVSVLTIGRSLIRLAGTDPTDPTSWAEWPDPEPD
jgi:hypothetical protein